MNSHDLHPAYFNVRFRGPWTDPRHLDEFAIITAYATTGETWSEEQNRAAACPPPPQKTAPPARQAKS